MLPRHPSSRPLSRRASGCRRALRRALPATIVAVLALFVASSAGAAAPPASNPARTAAPPTATPATGEAYRTAAAYYLRFYPRWFSYFQALPAPTNRLVGPARVTPLYKTVVAVNDDTLYGSAFVDVATEPAVLTIPATSVSYSLFTADMFGETFKTQVPARTPGTYLLTGPGWVGTVPVGMTQITVPYAFTNWIIRADRFTDGTDTVAAATEFRASLRLQTLAAYLAEPAGGATRILPEAYYAIPYKGLADRESRRVPILFLKQMQKAVHGEHTEPLSASDQDLSARFDAFFGAGGVNARGRVRAELALAVRQTHALILAHYLSHTIGNHWINFTNVGEWNGAYLDRDGITEYIQWGNNHGTAAYYHSFVDAGGAPLRGGHGDGYVLRFSKAELPQAKRFWSLTAYTPGAVELVPNAARKYLVASYTPHLRTAPDGSVSIYVATRRPAGVPAANWLPAPRKGPFNLMLRVYGPEGSVAAGTYVPPAIERAP